MDQNLTKNLTASGLVKTGYGCVEGVVIASHTSGTLKLWDNTSAAGTVLVDTLAFNVGEHFIDLYDMGYNTGLYATIGGTANITIVYC